MKSCYNILTCFAFALFMSSNAAATVNATSIIAKQTTKHEHIQPLHYLKFMLKAKRAEIQPSAEGIKHYKITFYGVKDVTLSITNSEYFTETPVGELVKKWKGKMFAGPVFNIINKKLTAEHDYHATSAYYFNMTNPRYDKVKHILSADAELVSGFARENKVDMPATGNNVVVVGHTVAYGEISQKDWVQMGYPLPCGGKIKPLQWFCN